MPDTYTIIANPAELRIVSTKLNAIRDTLSEDDLIRSLIFGGAGSDVCSKGACVSSMELLNAELDAVAKKLSRLSEATAEFLEKAATSFETADQI